MRVFRRVMLAMAGVVWMTVSAQAHEAYAAPQVQRAAAFARLYAVVRYFYPGDSAQTIDWNRLAIYGMQQASMPMSPAQWRDALNDMFAPLGPGIDVVKDGQPFPAWHGGRTAPLVAWRYEGFTADMRRPGAYRAERTGRSRGHPFVGISRGVPAATLLGRRIRLSGEIRALDEDATRGAGLMLRVDHGRTSPIFFRNTVDQQVHDRGWHRYQIETTVGPSATDVVVGFMLTLDNTSKPTAAAVRHLTLEVEDGHGKWAPLPMPTLADAGKEPGAWDPLGVPDTRQSQLTWKPGDDGKGYLEVSGQPVDVLGANVVPGKTVAFALGDGLKARVALTLGNQEALPATDRAASLAALKATLDRIEPRGLDTPAARQADVAETWGVLRHFYPYWDVIHIDWDAALPTALAEATAVDSRLAQKHVLQRLIAPLDDAHGTVWDSTASTGASLPVALAPVGQDWVVVASREARIKPGDVVTAIDGVPMPKAAREAEARASGRPGVRAWKVMQYLQWGGPGDTRTLTLRHADGDSDTITLTYAREPAPLARRPPAIAELKPGVWYLDLSRASVDDYTAHLSDLAHARAVIYDDRNYPKDFKLTKTLLTHLIRQPEHARWVHVPRYVGPFGAIAGYQESGWNLQPASPHFTSRALFLIDGNTISVAEAIAGYVQDDKLGTLVGSTTRGVDGNITQFLTPSGFGIVFTGMKVTHHDGVTRYHARGTPPDIAVTPTLQGIRAGRDEVLEAALHAAAQPDPDSGAKAAALAVPVTQ